MAIRRVSFEIYALIRGRWQLHASLPLSQRDTALETARTLDAEGFVDAVAVVKETFDPATNRAEELVLYQAGRIKAPPPTSHLAPPAPPKPPAKRPATPPAAGPGAKPGPGPGSGPPLDQALGRMVDEARRLLGHDMPAFPRFGVALFLAGMTDALARHSGLAETEASVELARNVTRLGWPAEAAEGFVANLEEYLLRGRQFTMYDAGRARVAAHLAGARGTAGLAEALARWSAPSTDPPPQPLATQGLGTGAEAGIDAPTGLSCVLLGDVPDAPRLGALHGQAWIGRVQRARDEILTGALERFGGRTLRQLAETEGAVAAMASPALAVEAALAIHRGARQVAELAPDLSFPMRLAVVAAPSIDQGGTPFTTPVFLARRLLIEALPGEIVVNAALPALLPEPRSFAFEPAGPVDLKGFDAPQPIYKVVRR